MTDDELSEFSVGYQTIDGIIGPTLGQTGSSLMIEAASRSTLTAHQRMAEADERARLRRC